jgi:predicted phage tail protein
MNIPARALPTIPLQIREVWLHGRLRKKYGGPFRLAVKSPGEAVRALSAQFRGLRQDFQKMNFWVVYGDLRRGVKLPLECVDFDLGSRPLHFYPIPHGAKNSGGFLKIIAGAALIAASFFAPELAPATLSVGAATAVGTVSLGIGVSLFLGGISALISPSPQTNTSNQTTASYVFQGPANVSSQGVAIPLCYGTVLAGSIVVAASLTNGDLLDGQVGTESKVGQTFGLST